MPSLVLLLSFVFELSSKNHRGGQNDPPPTRAKVNAFPPQNSENKRISSRLIDMIRVCDTSEHRPYPEVTFFEVKVI